VSYTYPNHQDAATLWYHDHALGITRLNVMMGLAGFYLLRDAVEDSLDLPEGVHEIPLVFQDRTFNPDGTLQYPAVWQDHFFGDKILVNGKVWPYLDVDQGKYRFRMLDGSNSRAYSLHLSTGDPITVIGTEGGLLTVPVAVDTLTLTPGERYDVVIDFAGYSAGTEILLVNSAPAPFPGPSGQGVVPDVMKFIVQGSPGHVDALPDTLRPVVDIPESTAVESRDFKLEKTTDPCSGTVWLINNLDWDTITEYPVLGSTEIWRFINPSGVAHPMHMHLVMFQVLDRQLFTAVGDSIVPVGDPFPPDSTQMGWKDTVPVYPGEMVRVIARFEDYLGQFPYHCHILEHEDHEMMRQFEVVSVPIGVGEIPLPAGLTLSPTFPNPFSASTTIEFSLPEPSVVSLRVFDIAGREVRTLVDGPLPEASHSVAWDGRDDYGRDVGGGIYFLRLAAGDRVLSRKVMRIR
jgi:spore coat protein A